MNFDWNFSNVGIKFGTLTQYFVLLFTRIDQEIQVVKEFSFLRLKFCEEFCTQTNVHRKKERTFN